MADVEVFASDYVLSDGSPDALANEVLSVVLGLSGCGDAPETCFDGGVDEVGRGLSLPSGSVKEVSGRDRFQIPVPAGNGGFPAVGGHSCLCRVLLTSKVWG